MNPCTSCARRCGGATPGPPTPLACQRKKGLPSTGLWPTAFQLPGEEPHSTNCPLFLNSGFIPALEFRGPSVAPQAIDLPHSFSFHPSYLKEFRVFPRLHRLAAPLTLKLLKLKSPMTFRLLNTTDPFPVPCLMISAGRDALDIISFLKLSPPLISGNSSEFYMPVLSGFQRLNQQGPVMSDSNPLFVLLQTCSSWISYPGWWRCHLFSHPCQKPRRESHFPLPPCCLHHSFSLFLLMIPTLPEGVRVTPALALCRATVLAALRALLRRTTHPCLWLGPRHLSCGPL